MATNKSIIIDGVNVAECENYKHAFSALQIEEYHDCVERALICPCNTRPNCYFKKLQRLKAENEKMKIKNKSIAKDSLVDIREILCHGRTFYDCYFNSDKLSRTDDMALKYKQALEEIKNLAELEVIIFDNKAFFPNNIQKIIDIINEVLK